MLEKTGPVDVRRQTLFVGVQSAMLSISIASPLERHMPIITRQATRGGYTIVAANNPAAVTRNLSIIKNLLVHLPPVDIIS